MIRFLRKSSPWQRAVAKFERAKARERQKRLEEAAERARWDAIRQAVYQRDHGLSRASGAPVELHSRNPYRVGHVHHIVFRSAGGSDFLENLVLISWEEHEMVHGRHPKFTLDILGGDANQTLRFEFRNGETGQLVKALESAAA